MEEKIVEKTTSDLMMAIGHQQALLEVSKIYLEDALKTAKFWKKTAILEGLVIGGLIAMKVVKEKQRDKIIFGDDFDDDFDEI
jgi:hypothetical protein